MQAGRTSSGAQLKTNKLGLVYFMGDVMCKWHGATDDQRADATNLGFNVRRNNSTEKILNLLFVDKRALNK